MDRSFVVHIRGPLAPLRAGVWAALLASRYSPLSALNLLRVTGHLSRWLEEEGLSAAELSSVHLERFFVHRRTQGYTQFLTPRCLDAVLTHLREVGVVPAQVRPVDDSWPNPLLRDYVRFLGQERGLRTAPYYVRTAEQFLRTCGARDAEDLGRLTTADVSRYVLREARSSSIGYAKLKVTALRSLLRFLHLRGLCTDLSGAAPAVAGHRSAGLPKALTSDDVERLLQGVDRRTRVGRRDFAMLLLLVRLGLRSHEVADLSLDDVDWISGTILVRGKGASRALLPLPRHVGDALVAYLKRGRPSLALAGLFLSTRAPYRQTTAFAVRAVVRKCGARAGVDVSSHRLRHTAGTQMLRRGASLAEVARVLRHRALETTAIYAKVDRLELRSLARPWPAGGAS